MEGEKSIIKLTYFDMTCICDTKGCGGQNSVTNVNGSMGCWYLLWSHPFGVDK